MSPDHQPKTTVSTIALEDITSARDKYVAGIQTMESEIQRLTRDRQATSGAVEALNRLIEQFTPKDTTPPAQ